MALRAFLRDVTAAILVFQNNETVAACWCSKPILMGFFSYVNPFICSNKFVWMLAKNAQLEPQCVPGVQLFTLGA